MTIWLINLVAQVNTMFLAANPQDEDGGGWLLLAGPAAGAALYGILFRYYRNTDKSHSFESETVIEAKPVTGTDAKVDEVRGTKRTSIPGSNGRKYRERVNRVY